MSKKMLFIFNPRSGKGSIKSRLVDILDIFVKGGYEVTVHPTQAYMDGLKVTKKRGGNYDLIVASGGDGTLDEVVYRNADSRTSASHRLYTGGQYQ